MIDAVLEGIVKKIVLTGVILFFGVPLAAHDDILSNADLFPSSPYKGVLTACMRVRGALEILAAQMHQKEDLDVLCDVIVGRLMHLDATIDALLPHMSQMHPEDTEYMYSMIHCMTTEIVQLEELLLIKERVSLLVKIAHQIREKIAIQNSATVA